MSKKFRCGLLLKKQDGSIKRLALPEGGGIRDCPFTHIDMGFDEIHDKLREVFSLEHSTRVSELYDFRLQKLDSNRYRTFFEYVNKNGLKFTGTLVYLCTSADDENTVTPEKRRTTPQPITPTPVPVVARISQVEADSSTPPVLIKIADSPPPDQKSTVESSLNPHTTNNLPKSPSVSFSSYSFEQALNELISYLRQLINQHNCDNIFIQLFEQICTIHGLSLINLDQIKQHSQTIDDQKKQIFNDILNRIEKLARAVKASIELNQMKISRGDPRSIIRESFSQFYQNLKSLHDQWTNKIDLVEPPTSTPSRPRRVDRLPLLPTPPPIPPLMSLPLPELLPTPQSSVSSSRHRSTRRSRKHARKSSSPAHRPSSDDNRQKNYSVFKNLLKAIDHLSNTAARLHITSLHSLVKSIVKEIEGCRANIKLSDSRSVGQAREFIIIMEQRLTRGYNDENHRTAPYGLCREVRHSFDRTLDGLRDVLNSFDYYRSQIEKNRRPKRKRWSSEDRPISVERDQPEHKPIIDTKQQQRRTDNDDQSSEASHSSFGDEVLMELARGAYEQRPKQSK